MHRAVKPSTLLVSWTFVGCLLFSSAAMAQPAAEPVARWWKGNLHTHTLWSDGNDFPEMVAAWYVEHGYNFLALSDHNVLSRGVRWMPLDKIIARSDDKILERYQQKFGKSWVELQGSPEDADCAVRLKPLDEFRCLVEQSGKFIMLEGEEISDKAEGKPVHMNASNLAEKIEPVGGATVQEAMANNLRLVLEHEKATGRQVLPHLNHPNFGYAITATDIAKTIEERFFEVFNGHPGVNQLGDKEHPSIDSMWDAANAMRLVALDAQPIYGIGTDDSHAYHPKKGGAKPGRGWVMVRAKYLTPEHIIKAMKAGDFYASSGVVLSDVQFDKEQRKLSLQIEAAGDAKFETQFIVLPKPKSGATDQERALPEATVAARATGNQPSYTMQPGDLYVRAIVTSTADHESPSWEGQKQQAWTQPQGW